MLQRPVESGQYTSLRFTEHPALEGIRRSIGSVGDAYDNALMESINGLCKAECLRTTVFHDGPYQTIADVEYAPAGWVDWYNNRRLHSTLGNVPPIEYEHTQGYGISEEYTGRWLAQGGGRRDQVVLATKVYQPMGLGPNDRRLSAYQIRRACEDSLRRLQTDHIDLYQMHHVDPATPWEEI